MSYLRSLASSLASAEVNWGPLSAYEHVVEAKSFENVLEKEFPYSCCVDGFGTWDDNYPLCKAMVDHDHDRIQLPHTRKVGDEINRKLFKGKGRGGWDQV